MLCAAVLAEAAQSLIGSPFRLHGRDPAIGLDCIGVLSETLGRAGCIVDLPNGYALRTLRLPSTMAHGSALGFVPVSGMVEAGDVLIFQLSPCQFHLAIATGSTAVVHAHAGLRRVVESSVPADWTLVEHWRLSAPEEKRT